MLEGMPYSNKGLPIILTQGEMEKMFLKGLYNFEVVLQFVLFFSLSNQVIFSCCHSGAQKVEVIGSPSYHHIKLYHFILPSSICWGTWKWWEVRAMSIPKAQLLISKYRSLFRGLIVSDWLQGWCKKVQMRLEHLLHQREREEHWRPPKHASANLDSRHLRSSGTSETPK